MSTQHLWFLHNLAQVHVSAPALSIVELSGAPGDTPPLHLHRDEDEAFHDLEGELTLDIADAPALVLRAGDAALAPRGVPHVYRVTSRAPARWIGTTTGGRFAAFVAELSTPAAAPRLPDPPDIDPAHVGAVAARHGIELLGPPGMLPRELEAATAR